MFVGTFAMLFFGPMFLEGRSHHGSNENGLGYYIIAFLLKHPDVQIGISILAALIYNGYTFVVNRKVQYVVQIHLVKDSVEVHLTNLYYSKMQKVHVSLAEFSYKIENKISRENEKKQKITFINQVTGEVIGIIDTKHFFWAENLREIRSMMKELKPLRILDQRKI